MRRVPFSGKGAARMKGTGQRANHRRSGPELRRPLPKRGSALLASTAVRREEPTNVSAGQILVGGRDRV
jgi:hypothetical protein